MSRTKARKVRVVTKPKPINDIQIKLKGVRSQEEIREMLKEAIIRREEWRTYFKDHKLTQKENVEALRNFTALRGVVKGLQWVLLDPNVEHPLD